MNLDHLRVWIYEYVVDVGAPPTAHAIAGHLSVAPEQACNALEALHERRELILHPKTREIWMAGPFSAVPTPFRVHGPKASYWPRCAWDMFGIAAFMAESVHAEAVCADCAEPFAFDIDASHGPRAPGGLVHILVPAGRWYEDVGFT